MKIQQIKSEKKKLPSEKESKSNDLISQQAAGMCFDFHPKVGQKVHPGWSIYYPGNLCSGGEILSWSDFAGTPWDWALLFKAYLALKQTASYLVTVDDIVNQASNPCVWTTLSFQPHYSRLLWARSYGRFPSCVGQISGKLPVQHLPSLGLSWLCFSLSSWMFYPQSIWRIHMFVHVDHRKSGIFRSQKSQCVFCTDRAQEQQIWSILAPLDLLHIQHTISWQPGSSENCHCQTQPVLYRFLD